MQEKPRRNNLRAKIIAWSFIPTALILLLVALTTFYAYQRVTEDFAIQRDVELTRLSASEIYTGFEDYVNRLWTLSRLYAIQQGDSQAQKQALEKQKNRLVYFDAGVYLLNNQGILVAASPDQPGWIGQDWSHRPYFTQMVRSTNPFFSDIRADGPDGKQVIDIAVPILGENQEFKGVALGMFQLDTDVVSPFYGTILKLRVGKSASAYIVDGNGRIIYDPQFKLISTSFLWHPVAVQALSDQVGAMRTRAPDGRDTVASYAPVPHMSWHLVLEENWSDLVRPVQGYGRFLVVLLILGIIVPVFVVMVGVRRITGPVNDFIAAAKRIASGDFNQAITVSTGDELEELAHQFNGMAAQLRESYATLERRVAERTRELSAVNSIAAVVSRSLDLDQILPDALSKTIELLKMDGGLVYRLDPEIQILTPVAQQGMEEPLRSAVDRLPLESSVASIVAETRQPVVRRVHEYTPGPIRSALEEIGAQLVVSIPLLAQEKVLGALNMFRRSSYEPTEEELSVAAAVGQQIGVAMENARLYAQTAEYARSMEAARQVAEEASASKSAFVANVSHELRTPLTSILGFTRIIQKRLEERILPNTNTSDWRVERAVQQMKDNLKIVLSEGERLTTLINDVLDLEKMEAGKMNWRMEALQSDIIIEQATAATTALFENRKKPLTLIKDLPSHLPQVYGDRDRLVQVIINLISNAVKFTNQGSITIRVQEGRDFPQGKVSPDEIVVGVIDTGIGISPEDLPKVFDKFKQVGDTLTDKPKGTGLGLSICKEIVEYHGGHIWAESSPGQGSSFYYTLPIYQPQETEQPVAQEKG